jgi:integrase
MRFTDSKIKGIKPPEKRAVFFEDSGLGVRVAPTGRKTFVFMYRVNGKQTMLTIGKYPAISLSSARLKMAQGKEKADKGIDPALEIKEKKAAYNTAPTVENLVKEYIERYAKINKKSWEQDERTLNKEVVLLWGKRKAHEVKQREIVLLLDDIVVRGSPVTANRTKSAISKMFNFAVNRGILDASPAVRIEKPAKETPRERALDENEIRIFWEKLEETAMTEGIKLVLKLLLLTGQRRGEVALAEWKEFDLQNGWWELPGEKTKNKKLHRIPLTEMTLDTLKRVKELSGDSPYLFPAPGGNKSITDHAPTKAVRRNEDIFGLSHFTPHDLRRTVITFMKQLGIDQATVDRVVNHIYKKEKMENVYDQYKYEKEKYSAMNTWSRKLEQILTPTDQPSKVIPIRS